MRLHPVDDTLAPVWAAFSTHRSLLLFLCMRYKWRPTLAEKIHSCVFCRLLWLPNSVTFHIFPLVRLSGGRYQEKDLGSGNQR